jgi:acyl carrier protein
VESLEGAFPQLRRAQPASYRRSTRFYDLEAWKSRDVTLCATICHMTMEEFLDQFGELLEMPPGSLRAEDKLSELEGWNSMAMVGFIALVDEQFGKTISPRLFATCSTVADLAKLAGLSA